MEGLVLFSTSNVLNQALSTAYSILVILIMDCIAVAPKRDSQKHSFTEGILVHTYVIYIYIYILVILETLFFSFFILKTYMWRDL